MDVHVRIAKALIVAAPAALDAYASLVGRLGLVAITHSSRVGVTASLASEPAIAILEVESGGCSLLRELRDRYADDLPVILVSAERTTSADVVAGLLVGADDYASESMDEEEFLARVRRLLERRHRSAEQASDFERLSSLTDRERQVLALIASGMTQKQVATALGISIKTVGAHVQNLLVKLGVHSRVEAVALATRVDAAAPAAMSLLSA